MRNFILIAIVCFLGCTKKLDLKPNNNLVLPKTVKDFENLLDNTEVMNFTPALAQLSADEYIIPSYQNWQSILTATGRNSYIWKPDIFEGATRVLDWASPYAQIFICNSVLDILEKQGTNDPEKMRIKGWALFGRAYSFYSLVSIYAKGYQVSTAHNDLGIPLKLNSSITELVKRSSVQESYDQTLKDALAAAELLQEQIPSNSKNRPSKVAAYALLARVYLSMRKYELAEIYVDKSLALYDKLTDYNILPVKTSSSFTENSEETIYFSQQVIAYSSTTYSTGALYGVEPGLVALYEPNDLRKSIYFRLNANGNYAVSKGINSPMPYPFTGLATDEMYLIKSECLARSGKITGSMEYLNQLLIRRWNPEATVPAKPYQQITADNQQDALKKILLERRKELIWRGIRWTDLKRLNLEGMNITLSRELNGTIHTLAPNSPKYVLPIPDYEIALSGILQNKR
jgi:tetratricopeptide (TPR) repeat protein